MHGHATWSWHALWPRPVSTGFWWGSGPVVGPYCGDPFAPGGAAAAEPFVSFRLQTFLRAAPLRNVTLHQFEIKCDCRFAATKKHVSVLGEKHAKPTAILCGETTRQYFIKRTIHVFIWVQDSKNHIYKQQITLKFLCVLPIFSFHF